MFHKLCRTAWSSRVHRTETAKLAKLLRSRLTALNLDSLELRRLRSDLCMMYKIVFGLCDVDTDNLYVLRLGVSKPTRGHRFKIMLEHCTNNYRKNLYSV